MIALALAALRLIAIAGLAFGAVFAAIFGSSAAPTAATTAATALAALALLIAVLFAGLFTLGVGALIARVVGLAARVRASRGMVGGRRIACIARVARVALGTRLSFALIARVGARVVTHVVTGVVTRVVTRLG